MTARRGAAEGIHPRRPHRMTTASTAKDRPDRIAPEATVTSIRARGEERRQMARRRYVLEQSAVAAGLLRSVLAGAGDPDVDLFLAHRALNLAIGELCRGSVAS